MNDLDVADELEVLADTHQRAFAVATTERQLLSYECSLPHERDVVHAFLSIVDDVWRHLVDDSTPELSFTDRANDSVAQHFPDPEGRDRKALLRHLGNNLVMLAGVVRGENHAFELARHAVAIAARPIAQKWSVSDSQFWANPLVVSELNSQQSLLADLQKAKELTPDMITRLRQAYCTA